MILQRASSLSCAATPLPQTFATGRFYRTSSCGNSMTGNARETRHCRPSSSTFGTPKNTVHAPYTPRTLRRGHRAHDRPPRNPQLRSSPEISPLAPRADEDKPHHRAKRNRRVQPPRLPVRVPPVWRSVGKRNPTKPRRAAPYITNQLSPARKCARPWPVGSDIRPCVDAFGH